MIIVVSITRAHHLDIVEQELLLAREKALAVHVGVAKSLCYADTKFIMKRHNRQARDFLLVIINADFIQTHRVLYPPKKACNKLEKQMKKKNEKNDWHSCFCCYVFFHCLSC